MLTMTPSSNHTALSINAQHVKQQFERRGDLHPAEFLHGEIAQRMFDRLRLIKLAPKVILDAGCSSGRRLDGLLKRFTPVERMIGQDHCALTLKWAQSRFEPEGFWQRTLSTLGLKSARSEFSNTSFEWLDGDLAQTGLAPNSVDLVWSNLALHWHPRPHDVLREWGRITRPGGLVFFSSYGPSTLVQLRHAIESAGLHTAMMSFVDMHDFGDLLIESGFADPVMDQELLTLTFKTGQDVLRDVAALGGNAASQRRAGLTTPQQRQKLIDALESQKDASGLIKLTIEVAYGHAWRSHTLKRGNETRISLDAIKRPDPK